MKKKRLLLTIVVALLTIIILLVIEMLYNACLRSPRYSNERKLIESFFGVTIPNSAIVTCCYVSDSPENNLWPYTADEMIEKDIIYEEQDVCFDELFNDNEHQIINLNFVMVKNGLDLMIPKRTDVVIYIYDTGERNSYIEIPRDERGYRYSFSDRAELRKITQSNKTYQRGLIRVQNMVISESEWGRRKVSITLSFTKWELEKLGIDSISNTIE